MVTTTFLLFYSKFAIHRDQEVCKYIKYEYPRKYFSGEREWHTTMYQDETKCLTKVHHTQQPAHVETGVTTTKQVGTSPSTIRIKDR